MQNKKTNTSQRQGWHLHLCNRSICISQRVELCKHVRGALLEPLRKGTRLDEVCVCSHFKHFFFLKSKIDKKISF